MIVVVTLIQEEEEDQIPDQEDIIDLEDIHVQEVILEEDQVQEVILLLMDT